jgi:uncharacterized protein YidB (DUF937 family)
MDFMDTLKTHLGSLLGGSDPASGEGGAGAPASLIASVLAMLKEHGLANFVQMLQSKGLGDLVASWVGTGPNAEVSGEQLARAFEPEQINELSRTSGVPAGQIPAMLAKILPGLIDKLTPDGLVEEGGMVDQALDFLKARLGSPATP